MTTIIVVAIIVLISVAFGYFLGITRNRNEQDFMETTSITTKYVRKPLFVDAVQVTEQNFADIARWCFGEIGNIDESPVDRSADVQPTKQYIHVRVHNPKNPRQTKAFVGDWILYTERGYKVYTTKAFQANFDLVEQD